MKKVILLILDGFGLSSSDYGNAVKLAKTPVLDKLTTVFPCSELEASGPEVGLPKGQMGNSEVGHLPLIVASSPRFSFLARSIKSVTNVIPLVGLVSLPSVMK